MENPQSSRVDRIKAKLNENPENILKHFNIDYIDRGSFLKCIAPCHKNADNRTGFTLWMDGYRGSWVCHTRNCNSDFGGDSLGLVQAILSFRKDKSVHFADVLDYCEKNIGISEAEPVDCDFTRLCEKLNKVNGEQTILGTKSILQGLKTPSDYFLNKGFSRDILQKFYVGDCLNPQKPMFNRAVCPILDEEGQNVLGCAGRRIIDKDYLQKWKYSYGFKSGSNLYGLWLAKPTILKTSRIILVEGMMDVAKLHEMGYTETVGLFGVNLTNNQLGILNRLGVMNVDFLLDGDEAGEVAGKRNYEKCKDYFNVSIHALPSGKDPDELSREELKILLKR